MEFMQYGHICYQNICPRISLLNMNFYLFLQDLLKAESTTGYKSSLCIVITTKVKSSIMIPRNLYFFSLLKV